MADRRKATQRGAAAAVTIVAVLGTGLATAQAAAAEPGPQHASSKEDPASKESAASRGEHSKDAPDHRSLDAAQVKQQLAQAAALQKDLRRANAKVAAASARLAALSARSSAAMSAVVAARAAQAQAQAIETRQLALLRSLSAQAAKAKNDVTGMAYDAYVNGPGELRDIATLVRMASESGNQDASLVQYLAGARAADGRRLTTLAAAQQATARAAVAARVQREAATARALAGQKKVETLLVAQRAALADLQKTAATTSSALGLKKAAVNTSVDITALNDVVTKPLCTQDTGTYSNGAIPASALCPIVGAPGHMMRPAAARGLNALKVAYRRDMGTDLCITDTYRSLAAQIDVKARKPVLAAKPGTSNHGWGLATDLCGGIESFGTVQHRWMQQHAPLFGFFHPQWAEPTGSKPEPWHWEFVQ